MNISDFINKFKSELDNDDAAVTPETDYVNSDFWDSLTNMAVTVMLDDDFQVEMSSEELNSFASVQELFDFIQSKQS